MRYSVAKAFLLTFLLTASLCALRAQDAGIPTDDTQGFGIHDPLPDPIAKDEALATENGPAPGDIPVDGGLSLLLAAGAAYGAGRLRRRAQTKDN